MFDISCVTVIRNLRITEGVRTTTDLAYQDSYNTQPVGLAMQWY